jgi:hypothetical protein
MPIDKPCIFCNGKYVKAFVPKEFGDYEISSLIINKAGTKEIQMAKSIVYQCQTCGNIQTFAEREPKV